MGQPGERAAKDPKRSRVFVVVSRRALIDFRFSTVICAPIYSSHPGLSTRVALGVESDLKHDSSIHCDELMSFPESALTDFGFVGHLPTDKQLALDLARVQALSL